jgi:MFS family permease
MAKAAFQLRGLPPLAFAFLYLPGGVAQGFVSVTFGYLLAQHGVSVGAIASFVGLSLLPSTCRFLMGPVLDMTLSSVKWFVICTAANVAAMMIMALSPLTPQAMPFLDLMALLIGGAGAASAASATAAMALTTPPEKRGAVAGWQTAGAMGGSGLGGGAGLWLAVHAGGAPVAGVVLSAACVLCAMPILWMRVPPIVHDAGLRGKTMELGRSLWGLLRRRRGVLVALMVLLPAANDAAANLFAAVAGDWRASADLVALVTGALGAVATIPGCIIGGYLCDRFPRRTVYIWAGLICAAGEAAMALAPHTPFWFAVMVLGNACLLGAAFAALSAVVFDCLGTSGTATISSLLFSLSNIPLVGLVMVVGRVQSRHGSTAMLMTEAVVAVVFLLGYAALCYLWPAKPGVMPQAALAPA